MIQMNCFNWIQLVKKSGMPSGANHVALYLATFMNSEHDIAWPSQSRISYETGLSGPTVRKWLNYLSDEGWLVIRRNAREIQTAGGTQLQNEYLINVPEDVIQRIVNDLPTQIQGGKTADERWVNESSKVGKQFTPNNNRNNNKNNKKEKKGFIKPSLSELKTHILDNSLSVDPENFIDFYESKGWMVGKNKMKCWKAALRTWHRRNKSDEENNRSSSRGRPMSAVERVEKANKLGRYAEVPHERTLEPVLDENGTTVWQQVD